MRSKDVLKYALKRYNSTLIVVSHDREFLNDLTDKLYEFKDSKIHEYRGGIYDYLNKRNIDNLDDLNLKRNSETDKKLEKPVSNNKNIYSKRKELDKRIRKIENRIEFLEKKIEDTESQMKEMEMIMAGTKEMQDIDFYNNYERLKQKVKLTLDDWENLQHVLERLKDERNSVL